MFHAYAATEPMGRLVPFSYDPGLLKDDEVQIRIEFCGICHSDLSMLNNDWGLTSISICSRSRSGGYYRG